VQAAAANERSAIGVVAAAAIAEDPLVQTNEPLTAPCSKRGVQAFLLRARGDGPRTATLMLLDFAVGTGGLSSVQPGQSPKKWTWLKGGLIISHGRHQTSCSSPRRRLY
jgi:hypothetical protein